MFSLAPWASYCYLVHGIAEGIGHLQDKRLHTRPCEFAAYGRKKKQVLGVFLPFITELSCVFRLLLMGLAAVCGRGVRGSGARAFSWPRCVEGLVAIDRVAWELVGVNLGSFEPLLSFLAVVLWHLRTYNELGYGAGLSAALHSPGVEGKWWYQQVDMALGAFRHERLASAKLVRHTLAWVATQVVVCESLAAARLVAAHKEKGCACLASAR